MPQRILGIRGLRSGLKSSHLSSAQGEIGTEHFVQRLEHLAADDGEAAEAREVTTEFAEQLQAALTSVVDTGGRHQKWEMPTTTSERTDQRFKTLKVVDAYWVLEQWNIAIE